MTDKKFKGTNSYIATDDLTDVGSLSNLFYDAVGDASQTTQRPREDPAEFRPWRIGSRRVHRDASSPDTGRNWGKLVFGYSVAAATP